MPRPRSAVIAGKPGGVQRNWIRSCSNTSIASKRAAAIASSFSASVPEIETVAIDLRTALLRRCDPRETGDRQRIAIDAETDDDGLRDGRQPRVMAKRLAGVHVGDVQFDHWHVRALDR